MGWAGNVFMSAAVVDGLPAEVCAPYFHNEFLQDDVNKFARLASGSRIGTLHAATGGRPGDSARHNELNAPLGFGPELRAAFTTAAGAWGVANLLRERGAPDFSAQEVALVRAVSGHVAEGLRAALRNQAPRPGPDGVAEEPAVVVFDADGSVGSLSPAAARLLAACGGLPVTDGQGATVPAEAYIVAAQARALAAGRGGPPARARVQDRGGRWLSLSASCPRDAAGQPAHTVLVVELARPAQVAPIIVEAHDLTRREQEVVRLLARGLSNHAIARELCLSPHTVKDHVKAVLEKLDVDSRQMILAKLFRDDLQPAMTNH